MEATALQQPTYIQWIFLSLMQGLTEYLPVSSSAHLVLTSKVMSWKDQGLIIDMAAHSGSLLAVMIYFKKELLAVLSGKNTTLFLQLVIATVPIAVIGFFAADFIELYLRSPLVIALASIVFGVLLYLADAFVQKSDKQMDNHSALILGFSQVLALIPGASRSGVTMTSAMAQGFSRKQAARFSFLMAIPVLMMTTAYVGLKLIQTPQTIDMQAVAVVAGISFFASLISIQLFLKWIEKISMAFFMWYRVLLGLLILWFLT